jgi:hypothetical protein
VRRCAEPAPTPDAAWDFVDLVARRVAVLVAERLAPQLARLSAPQPPTPKATGVEWLSTREASMYCRVARGALEQWRRTAGEGPPFVKVGQRVRYKRSELDKFMAGDRG